MHLATLLVTAMTAASAATVDKRLNLQVYCGDFVNTDGECEYLQLTGYCCSPQSGGKFTTPRTVGLSPKSWFGTTSCPGGKIYCCG
ncbi:hypothetical protein E4U42_001763 [Claviceps africana]|uniref:Uncharacterized protein n=1 Tax=Claviceps africana TaxID=83212 RepID=A0A8K0NMP7_9HYPO|nr:hypothetical protein E4U42_001763 [Claviceps africana]